MLTFSTFWFGPEPSNTEWACLESFVRKGYQVCLYTYQNFHTVPEGIQLRDAGRIAPREHLEKFVVFGKPSLSHFSDYFRLKLFAHEDTFWIDSDVLLLKNFEWTLGKRFFAKETPDSICNAILHIPKDDPILPILIADVESMMTGPIRYGETGKDLIFKHLGAETVLAEAQAIERYYPVHFDDFWKPLLPEFRDECVTFCANAVTVHLWNNLYEKTGLWKDIRPPAGSYLDTLFGEVSSVQFQKQYPENVVRQAVRNYLHLDIGLLTLAKRFCPAVMNTYRRKIQGRHDKSWK